MRSIPNPGGTTLARLESPVSREPTRIGVVSDAHVATRAEGTDKMFHTTEERLENSVDALNSADPAPDLVLFNGDLTKDGEPWNFDRFDEILSDLRPPFAATPGNHDVPKSWDDHESPSVAEFAERYAPEPYPFVRRVGGVDLVVLNSASTPEAPLTDSHRGMVSRSQLDRLGKVLEEIENPVVALHHSMVPILPEGFDEGFRSVYSLQNRQGVLDVLDGHDVPMAVTAHHHIPDVRRVGSLTEITSPPTCSYPQAHLLIDIDEHGTTVRMVPHANEDEQVEAYEALSSAPNRRSVFAEVASKKVARSPLVDETTQRLLH